MTFEVETLKVQKALRILLWGVGVVLVLTIGLAIWQYPEPYEFFGEHVSNLGGIQSETLLNNYNSSMIMIIGFGFFAAISFAMAIIYFVSKRIKFNITKGVLTLAIAGGAAGVAVPRDHSTLYQWHYVGAALFILGFAAYNFVCQARRYYRKHGFIPEKKNFNFWIDFIFVWIVLAAFVMYMVVFLLMHFTSYTNILSGPIAQKIVLIVDLIAVIIFDTNDM